MFFFHFICFAAHLMTWTLNISCTALGSNLWAHSDPYPHNNSALQSCFGKSCPKSMPPLWVQTKSGYFFLSCHPSLCGMGQKMPRMSEKLFPACASLEATTVIPSISCFPFPPLHFGKKDQFFFLKMMLLLSLFSACPLGSAAFFGSLRSRNPRLWKGRGKAKGWFEEWWGGRRDTE